MAVMTAEPIKSEQDHKSYKRLKLDNGLDVLLIHDPEMEASSSADIDAHMATDADSDGHGDAGSSLQGDSEEDSESMAGDEDDRQHVKKAAAAMAVGVGSFSDPEDVPGMSHYLEHMLFMGSERFPDENDYDSYLQHHGGAANAYTEMLWKLGLQEHTNFYFDCKPAALRGALDRFSQFFVAPLCKADALEREVNAVDNEFSGVQQDDGSRLAQLRCHTAKEGHTYQKFTWGNRKSLVELPASRGIDVRSALVQYYKSNYSAERMVLVVLGGEPLDILEQWVKALFLAVPSGRGPRPVFDHLGRPYTGGRLHVVPAVKQGHNLTLTFQLPSLFHAYRAKPEDYVSHLLGHEGRGSLLAALKAQGWASAISAGVAESGYERNSAVFVFEVTVTLTEAGLHQSPGLGLAAAPLVFSYIEMLRDAGPQRWVFDELAAVAEQRFRFAEDEEASEYVSRLAASLTLYAPEHALNGSYLHEEWRPELVTEVLECMTPSNCRLDLQSCAFEALQKEQKLLSASDVLVSTEPWFDLPYMALPLPTDILRAWEHPPNASSLGLALPQRNHFIPTDFSLCAPTADSGKDARAKQAAQAILTAVPDVAAKADNGHAPSSSSAALQPLEDPPSLIADAPGLQIWHKLDRVFKRPIAVAYLCITPRSAYDSARTAALTHLVLKLLQDDVCETAYLADVAGLQYDAWPEGMAGIELKVNGFSHKLPLLLEQLVQALVSLKVDAGSFTRNKEVLIQKYQNANMHPDRHASYLRLMALKQRMWRLEDVLSELQALTPQSVQEALPGLLQDTHITALVQGNFTAQNAFEMASSARKAMSNGILLASERSADRVVVLPTGTLLHRAPVKNTEEANSVAEVYCQAGPSSVALRARLDLFEQLFSEPFYDTLRTKEQLGYSVHCSARLTHGILGFAFVVISGGHGPVHLQKRIDAFLEGVAGKLGSIDEAEFEGHRAALIAAKLQKDHALGDEADRNWEQISNRRYNFLAREEEVEELQRLTLKDVQQTYETYLKPTSREARRLAVHVVGKEHAEELSAAAEPCLGTLKPEITDFRAMEHYPAILGQMPPIAQD